MHNTISKQQIDQLVGKQVYVMKKDGTTVSGKLVRNRNGYCIERSGGSKAVTQAFLPLVLFDLLAIGTEPFGFGGFGPFGFGGFGPFGFGGFF